MNKMGKVEWEVLLHVHIKEPSHLLRSSPAQVYYFRLLLCIYVPFDIVVSAFICAVDHSGNGGNPSHVPTGFVHYPSF